MLILHGDDVVASRKFLNQKIKQARVKGDEVVKFDGKRLGLTKLQQVVESKALFGGERLVVIENLLSSPPSIIKTKLINYLKGNIYANVILWEGKEIKNLAGLRKAEIQLFRLPPIIFKFLDSLAPQKGKECLKLLHLCLKESSVEMVFYMLTRQVRLLIIASDLGQKGLSGVHPFQQRKITHQAGKFTLPQLLSLHRKLLKIDWQQKTGQTPHSLISQLDLLIASL